MNGETLAVSEQVKKSKADHLRLNARTECRLSHITLAFKLALSEYYSKYTEEQLITIVIAIYTLFFKSLSLSLSLSSCQQSPPKKYSTQKLSFKLGWRQLWSRNVMVPNWMISSSCLL